MNNLKILLYEIRAGFLSYYSYRFTFFSDFIIFIGIYFAILYFGSGTSLSNVYGHTADKNELVFIGYVLWIISSYIISDLANTIRFEATIGVLEKRFMSIIPFKVSLIYKCISSMISSIILVLLISLFLFIVMGNTFSISITAVALILVTIFGMHGISLVIASIMIRLKKMGQLLMVINFCIFTLSDVTAYNNITVFNKIIPLGYGNHLIRSDYVGLKFDTMEYLYFISICIIWVFVGNILFSRALDKVRKDGTLDMY